MYTSFPKVELHIHLDCSLSFKVVECLLPGISHEEYSKMFAAPINCCSLNDYIACAQAAINIMQTKKQLRLITLDLLAQIDADKFIASHQMNHETRLSCQQRQDFYPGDRTDDGPAGCTSQLPGPRQPKRMSDSHWATSIDCSPHSERYGGQAFR